VITQALHVGSALLATEQVGAAQHLLDLSVGYAKSRLQFGRPIGSFQAVSIGPPMTSSRWSTRGRPPITPSGR